jgi:hypothetical protein
MTRDGTPLRLFFAGFLICVAHNCDSARGEEGVRGAAPLTPRSAAQLDLTGYWVSVITQDWIYRMTTPKKDDFGSIPLNAAGFALAKQWDPSRDVGEEQCKAYGAPGVMRQPGRVHIYWEDERTLRIDLTAGEQTRLLHFSEALPPAGFGTSEIPIAMVRTQGPPGPATLQGYSLAAWQKIAQTRGLGIVGMTSTPPPTPGEGGTLRVLTTHLQSGYLQKNGIPYSSDAVLTEYFDLIHLPGGGDYLVQTSILEDPTYLTEPYVTSAQFYREPDGSSWTTTPCRSR